MQASLATLTTIHNVSALRELLWLVGKRVHGYAFGTASILSDYKYDQRFDDKIDGQNFLKIWKQFIPLLMTFLRIIGY